MNAMVTRTTETAITFRRPFEPSVIDHPLPAGTYRVEFDEEEITGLSFLAFKRSSTLLHVPAVSAISDTHQVIRIELAEFDALIEADRADLPAATKE